VKTRLYEALVLSTLLYNAELWPVSVTQMKKREAAHHTTDGSEASWAFLEGQGDKMRKSERQLHFPSWETLLDADD